MQQHNDELDTMTATAPGKPRAARKPRTAKITPSVAKAAMEAKAEDNAKQQETTPIADGAYTPETFAAAGGIVEQPTLHGKPYNPADIAASTEKLKAAFENPADAVDRMMELFDAIDPERELIRVAKACDIGTNAGVTLDDFKAELPALGKRVTEAISIYHVKDDTTEKIAIETGVLANTITQRLEKERKTAVEDLNARVIAINADFKIMAAPFEKIKEFARGKINLYREDKAAKAKAEADRIQALLDAQRQKQIADAKAAGKEITGTGLTIPVAPIANTTHSDTGKAVGTKRWTARILNPMHIPAEYMIPDITKINAAIRAGVREIPGVEIKQDASVQFRA